MYLHRKSARKLLETLKEMKRTEQRSLKRHRGGGGGLEREQLVATFDHE